MRTVLSKKHFLQQSLPLLGCILIFCFLLYRLHGIGPVVLDDAQVRFYAMTPQALGRWIASISAEQGRLSYYLTGWLWVLPYLVPSAAWFELWRGFWLAACLVAYWFLIRELTNASCAFFCCTLVMVFFSVSDQHNLLVCYIGFLHFPFVCTLAGLTCLLRYLSTRKKRWYGASVLLAFLAGFCQEGFLLYYAIYAYLLFGWMLLHKGSFRACLKPLVPYVMAGALNLLIDVSWSLLHPNMYLDAESASLGLVSRIGALFSYAFGNFPGYSLLWLIHKSGLAALRDAWTLLLPVWILLAGGWLLWRFRGACRNCPPISHKKWLLLVAGSLLFALITPLLHVVTTKYVQWFLNRDAYAYTISFFSYFGLLSAVGFAGLWLLRQLKTRRAQAVLYSLLGLCTCLLLGASGLADQHYQTAIRTEQAHFSRYDAFFARPENFELVTGSNLYLQDDCTDCNPGELLPRVTLSCVSQLANTPYPLSTIQSYSEAADPIPENSYLIRYDDGQISAQPLPPTE